MKEFITILSLLDLTTLESTDNREKVRAVCKKAISIGERGLPAPAAVCVYPVFVNLVRHELYGTSIKIASVAGAFPSGQSPLHVRLAEVQYALNEGDDEIDMVISRGRLIEGDEKYIFDEIAAFKETCREKRLKVILETGELTHEQIRKASEIAISAGADFLKTSTGKSKVSATTETFWIMLDVIKQHYERTGKRIGIKAAGGISDPETAMRYYRMVKDLGKEWLNPKLFRFGASRLADTLVSKISKPERK